MGTNTSFIGAIRIVPAVEPALAERLNDFLTIRHMKRSVPQLQRLYKSVEERQERTLLHDGNFGEEGALFLPVLTRDLERDLKDDGTEGLMDQMSVNTPPHPCPGLYSNIILATSQDRTCSYLGWDGSEKTYDMGGWLEFLALLLVPLGYHLDGIMIANEEYGLCYSQIEVADTDVFEQEFGPGGTYQEEFEKAVCWTQQEDSEEGK